MDGSAGGCRGGGMNSTEVMSVEVQGRAGRSKERGWQQGGGKGRADPGFRKGFGVVAAGHNDVPVPTVGKGLGGVQAQP